MFNITDLPQSGSRAKKRHIQEITIAIRRLCKINKKKKIQPPRKIFHDDEYASALCVA